MTLPADFAATLVDEWVRSGVRHAVIAPGSRSAPLARALLADGRFEVDVRLDERSAGFFALGLALSSGRPVVVVTTSGTAAAELHPAVLEADLAGVPLICCTADRPPELHRIGAPQTLEQEGLFGNAVRFACSPGVPDEAGRSAWRSIAARVVGESLVGPNGPGPVHLNLAFREPLVTEVGSLPEGRAGGRPWHEVVRGAAISSEAVAALVEACAIAERGLVLVGDGAAGASRSAAGAASPATAGAASPATAGAAGGGREAVLALAEALGWPVLDDARAWPRLPAGTKSTLVAAGDHVLRSETARRLLEPDLVLRLGSPPASKVLSGWLAGLPATTRQLLVDPYGRWQDPERRADLVLRADPGLLASAALGRLGDPTRTRTRTRTQMRAQVQAQAWTPSPASWGERWRAAEASAQQAMDELLGSEQRLSEPGLARALYAAAPPGSAIVVSSSMPVRDLEWFAAPRPGAPQVLSNRGGNGIDGVTSTVLGVARARSTVGSGPTIGLLGDLAFFHDLSGLLWGTSERPPPARLVVVDNAGGAIFSFLPYAADLERPLFERAFGTPQRPEIAAVAGALGHRVQAVEHRKDLQAALAGEPEGIEVLLVRSDRDANLATHRALERAVVAAVEAALS